MKIHWTIKRHTDAEPNEHLLPLAEPLRALVQETLAGHAPPEGTEVTVGVGRSAWVQVAHEDHQREPVRLSRVEHGYPKKHRLRITVAGDNRVRNYRWPEGPQFDPKAIEYMQEAIEDAVWRLRSELEAQRKHEAALPTFADWQPPEQPYESERVSWDAVCENVRRWGRLVLGRDDVSATAARRAGLDQLMPRSGHHLAYRPHADHPVLLVCRLMHGGYIEVTEVQLHEFEDEHGRFEAPGYAYSPLSNRRRDRHVLNDDGDVQKSLDRLPALGRAILRRNETEQLLVSRIQAVTDACSEEDA
jgi:hypothetical protein